MVESINWVVCLSMDDLYLMWYGNELLSLLIMVWDPVTFQGNSESRTDASPKFSQGKQLQKYHEFDPQIAQCLKITQKSLIQYCERSEPHLQFEWTKKFVKNAKNDNLTSFWKPKACGHIVLPDWSISIRQKLVKMPKWEKSNVNVARFARNIEWDFSVIFIHSHMYL